MTYAKALTRSSAVKAVVHPDIQSLPGPRGGAARVEVPGVALGVVDGSIPRFSCAWACSAIRPLWQTVCFQGLGRIAPWPPVGPAGAKRRLGWGTSRHWAPRQKGRNGCTARMTTTTIWWPPTGMIAKLSHLALRQGIGHVARLTHFVMFCEAHGKDATR